MLDKRAQDVILCWRQADGLPADILRVNGDFMGCVVEPGAHEVLLDFRPWSLRAGFALSGAGLAMLGVMALIAILRPNRGGRLAPAQQ